jgi:glycosyltransferase involved in cell wall biosynthesis
VRISVFTPSHNPRYLDDCYASLAAQTFRDWEWIVLLNGKATSWSPSQPDERVRVERPGGRVRGVGAAKRAACELATGDVLVELDHDDLLTPSALLDIADAMTSPERPVLVYSDFAQINDDGSPNTDRFDLSAGWDYSPETVGGTTYDRCHAMAATPHNVGYIWHAPNHVRAFRRTSYDDVGGYDAGRDILDDHDLMIRLFKVGDFHHIDKLLYLQRMHGRNTQSDPATNAVIQQETVALYLEHIESIALAWAERHQLAMLSLTTPTSVNPPEIDARFTLVSVEPGVPRLRYENDAVGVIKATDVLQRMPDRAAFLNECHRVLRHAGLLLTDTPSTDGRGAFQDPSHVAFYNENSFMYLTQAGLRPTIPMLSARLQLSHLQTYWPSPVHEQLDIPYVKGNLLAIKDGPRQGGPLLS